MSISWLDKEDLFPRVQKRLEPACIVLDIGCGINPQQCIRPLVHICCEPFDQYLQRLKEKISDEYDRSYVLLRATWAEAVRFLPPKSVDTVFLVDVIEHIEKQEGLELLRSTEEIARRQIAIFTPLGFLPQKHPDGTDAWGMGGGAWQEHRSGWLPEDFDGSWDIYVAETFHTTDNLGYELEKPHGAFWAVKTLSVIGDSDQNAEYKKEKVRSIVSMAADIKRDSLLSLSVLPMELALKIQALAITIRRTLKGRGEGSNFLATVRQVLLVNWRKRS